MSAGIGAPTSASTAAAPSPSASASRPAPAACTIFPADNVWHADFGSGTWDGGPIGIPITTVEPGQATARVSFEYGGESDRGPYPIPRDALVEGGPNSTGDRHVILYEPGRCRAYELFSARRDADGSWRAGSGAIFDLRADTLRRQRWTSADAAGLPIIAGLVRYDEIAAGHIDHAIRVTAPRTRTGYLWPARHSASGLTDPALPRMGQRLRLKPTVKISGLPRQARIVAEAMRRYGVIVADHGSAWYISGTPDSRWDNDALHALGGLKGSDFEAVDTSVLMTDPDSAAVRP